MYYTVKGDARGECSHTHRTWEGAEKCRRRDAVQCQQAGGYSDQSIYRVDDDGTETLSPLSPAEMEHDEVERVNARMREAARLAPG